MKIRDAVLSDSFFVGQNKYFSTFSGSIGAVYSLSDENAFFLNMAKAFRSPSADELASYGVHEAANSFDIGNRNLSVENNSGVDLGWRLITDDYTMEITGYYNSLNNYISGIPQSIFYSDENNPVSDLPIGFNDSTGVRVKKYQNNEAIFYGFESKSTLKLGEHLAVTIISDYVRAKNSRTNENLPQIPPFRFSLESRYTVDQYWFGFSAKSAATQNFVAVNETPTAGYFLLDLYGGVKFFSGRYAHIVSMKIENALKREYRDHLSVIKDFTLNPGRNISLSYKFLF